MKLHPVRYQRKKRHIPQATLAKRLKMTPASLSRLETGAVIFPELTTLQRLAGFFNMEWEQLGIDLLAWHMERRRKAESREK